MFVHNVLFTLKDADKDALTASLIADAMTYLKVIPTVRCIAAGRPTPRTRPGIDSAYDVGLCVIFDDKAAHDIYQDHPSHVVFKNRQAANWTKIRVIDFE